MIEAYERYLNRGFDEPQEKPERIEYVACFHDSHLYPEHEMIKEEKSGEDIHYLNVVAFIKASLIDLTEPDELKDYEEMKNDLLTKLKQYN
jgi:hypothetical protein